MKKLIALACLGLSLSVAAPVFAGAQQDKMKGCSKEARDDGLKGDERKAFMKKCLSKDYVLKSEAGKPEAAATAPEAAKPQDRMKSCNADAKAKNLGGDERKAFMKTCLKG